MCYSNISLHCSVSNSLIKQCQYKQTFRCDFFFCLLFFFLNTPHLSYNADNDPPGQTELFWSSLQGECGGEKYLKQVISGGSWNNWCWAQALVPCGVVIESRWLWHKDSKAGKKVGRQPVVIMFVGRWMFTHWPLTWGPCACSEMQAHLPVTLEEGKKMGGREGGGGKKHALEGSQLLP